jgi:uncharacterized repeat protein (TIGR03803 family)
MFHPGRNQSLIAGITLRTLALKVAVVFGLIALATEGHAQSFKVIYAFSGQKDGANPLAGVTINNRGDLFGTASAGGDLNYGGVFKLKRSGSSWVLSPLYSFTGGQDGAQPRAVVITGRDGALYGTTFLGGGTGCSGQGCGIVFRLAPPPFACKSVLCPWTETVLYRFAGGTDGGGPLGDLVFDAAGNLYGTTQAGGQPHSCGGRGCGVVYELTNAGGNWTENVLYQFTGGSDGGVPNGGVIFDHSGNLLGTTLVGGPTNNGTVFQLTPSGSGWIESVLYSFQNLLDGSEPDSGLLLDASGNLYGSTFFGGTGLGGTVFELTPSMGSWVFNVVWGLTGRIGPLANLSMDGAGNLYGTTYQDGDYIAGSVFELTPSQGGWTYSSLHDFMGGNDGALPVSNVVFDSSGNLFGTAGYGGINGYGVIWEITP